MSNLISLPELIKRLKISKTSIYRMIKAGKFPRPLRLGARASRWREDEIEKWIASRARATAENFDLNTG